MTHSDDDYILSRNTLRDLIEIGMSALPNVVNLAEEAEHPRAFEVLFDSIKKISDVNERLVSLQIKKAMLDKSTAEVNAEKALTIEHEQPKKIFASVDDVLKGLEDIENVD